MNEKVDELGGWRAVRQALQVHNGICWTVTQTIKDPTLQDHLMKVIQANPPVDRDPVSAWWYPCDLNGFYKRLVWIDQRIADLTILLPLHSAPATLAAFPSEELEKELAARKKAEEEKKKKAANANRGVEFQMAHHGKWIQEAGCFYVVLSPGVAHGIRKYWGVPPSNVLAVAVPPAGDAGNVYQFDSNTVTLSEGPK